MKAAIIVFLFFTFIGVWYAFVMKQTVDQDEFATWTLEDESAVEKLPLCPWDVAPVWEWNKANMSGWPCRIDLIKTVK